MFLHEFSEMLRKFLVRNIFWDQDDPFFPTKPSEWGSSINWMPLKEGQTQAELEKKPLAVIAYLPGCPRCGALKSSIAKSTTIPMISDKFVMVLIDENGMPEEKKYYPDSSAYVPRILFYRHDGTLMPRYFNELGDPDKKYYYINSWTLYQTMEKVMNEYDFRD